VKGFAEVAAPLFSVEVAKKQLVWTAECQKAFEKLRIALVDTVLVLPNFKEPFIVETDASNFGIGGVLSQFRCDFNRPIAFFSRYLSSAERNYTVTEKELYAIVKSVEHFAYYLHGREFTVITDH